MLLEILQRKRNTEDAETFRKNLYRIGNAVKMTECTSEVMHLLVALSQSGLRELEDEAIANPSQFCQQWRLAFAQLSQGKKI